MGLFRRVAPVDPRNPLGLDEEQRQLLHVINLAGSAGTLASSADMLRLKRLGLIELSAAITPEGRAYLNRMRESIHDPA